MGYSRPKMHFTLTEEHIKLLRNAYVSWNDCEYGAPQIDPKRPYGNSNVAKDIVEILGWDVVEDEHGYLPDEVKARARTVHEETFIALQIALQSLALEPGEYEGSAYGARWTRVE